MSYRVGVKSKTQTCMRLNTGYLLNHILESTFFDKMVVSSALLVADTSR